MKRLVISMLFAVMAIGTFSQDGNADDQKKKINAIKKSSSYIFAEVTTTNEEQALELAYAMLTRNIDEWAAKQKKFAGSTKTVTLNQGYSTEKITMPRANMYRAFVYVKKSDIIPATNVDVRATAPEVAEPVQSKSSKQASKKVKDGSAVSVMTARDTVIGELLAIENTGQLTSKLDELVKAGKVAEYSKMGKLNKEGKNLADYIMVVYNRDGLVEALLSEGEARTNLKTQAADSMSNYKGRFALGVKLNP